MERAELNGEGAEPSSEEPNEKKNTKEKERKEDGTKNLTKVIDRPFSVSLATKSASSVEF